MPGLILPLRVEDGGTGDSGTEWVSWTPVVSTGVGSFPLTTTVGRYKLLGKTCFMYLSLNILSMTVGTKPPVMLSSPLTVRNTSVLPLVFATGQYAGQSGVATCQAGDSNWTLTAFNGTFSLVANQQLVASGVVELA